MTERRQLGDAMEENGHKAAIGSGVEYPTLEIDGKVYTIKFSRASFYRLDKAGFDLKTLPNQFKEWFPRIENGVEIPGQARFSVVIDVLHAAISKEFRGTAEDLAEVIDPERLASGEVVTALTIAMLKMLPPPVKPQATAATPGEAVQ